MHYTLRPFFYLTAQAYAKSGKCGVITECGVERGIPFFYSPSLRPSETATASAPGGTSQSVSPLSFARATDRRRGEEGEGKGKK